MYFLLDQLGVGDKNLFNVFRLIFVLISKEYMLINILKYQSYFV